MFLLLLVPVVLKAGYFLEKIRIRPWRCRARSSPLQTPVCRPAVCTEPAPFQRPRGETHGRPARGRHRSSTQQHRPCSAGNTSGRPAEPTSPSPASAQHPTGRKRARRDTGAACLASEPGARIPWALQRSLTTKHRGAALRLQTEEPAVKAALYQQPFPREQGKCPART